MVCEAICYNGSIGLEGSDGKTDADYYTMILGEGLLPAADDAMGDLLTLQQDDTSILTAEHTSLCPEDNKVHVLD